MSGESWTCSQCQQVNASYAETCGRCSTPKEGPKPTAKFRFVMDLDIPEGHLGITQEAVADHYASLLRLNAPILLESHLLLKREALSFHGVRPVTPPRPEEPSG